MNNALCLVLFALMVAGCDAGCASVDVAERDVLPAQRAESSRSAVSEAASAAFPGVAYEELAIEAADGTALYGALLRQPDADLTILHFGGNGFTVERLGVATARALLPLGVNVVLVDHRGYGWSDGEPSVSGLQSDALMVFDRVAALPNVGGVVVHGLSLGSFIAGYVGANRDAAGVVLEASATTPEEWAEARVPLFYKPFVRIRVEESLQAIDNRAAVERITEPLLLLVGDEDEVTPPVLSHRLYEASPLPKSEKTLVVVEGAGHGVQQQAVFAGVYQAFLDRVRDKASQPSL